MQMIVLEARIENSPIRHCRVCGMIISNGIFGESTCKSTNYCMGCRYLPQAFVARKCCAECQSRNPQSGWAAPFAETQLRYYPFKGKFVEIEVLFWLCQDCYREWEDYHNFQELALKKKAA